MGNNFQQLSTILHFLAKVQISEVGFATVHYSYGSVCCVKCHLFPILFTDM